MSKYISINDLKSGILGFSFFWDSEFEEKFISDKPYRKSIYLIGFKIILFQYLLTFKIKSPRYITFLFEKKKYEMFYIGTTLYIKDYEIYFYTQLPHDIRFLYLSKFVNPKGLESEKLIDDEFFLFDVKNLKEIKVSVYLETIIFHHNIFRWWKKKKNNLSFEFSDDTYHSQVHFDKKIYDFKEYAREILINMVGKVYYGKDANELQKQIREYKIKSHI